MTLDLAELRRRAEAAAAYEAPWELAGAELAPAAYDWWSGATPQTVLALLDRIEELEGALGAVENGPERAQAIWERRGVVFDKWPPKDIPREGWTADNFAALDPEVRWQGIAFSIYTNLCELSGQARAALGEPDHE